MSGHRFVVSGDAARARDTVYASLTSQGFTLTPTSDWSANAERGSAGASIAFGALAGKKGRHVKLSVSCQSAQEGIAITLEEGTIGISGGLIGMSQANTIYSEIYNMVGSAFQNAGILISGGGF